MILITSRDAILAISDVVRRKDLQRESLTVSMVLNNYVSLEFSDILRWLRVLVRDVQD